jgi:hypothetical protein
MGYVQHTYHEISLISFENTVISFENWNFAANGQNFSPAPDGVSSAKF